MRIHLPYFMIINCGARIISEHWATPHALRVHTAIYRKPKWLFLSLRFLHTFLPFPVPSRLLLLLLLVLLIIILLHKENPFSNLISAEFWVTSVKFSGRPNTFTWRPASLSCCFIFLFLFPYGDSESMIICWLLAAKRTCGKDRVYLEKIQWETA